MSLAIEIAQWAAKEGFPEDTFVDLSLQDSELERNRYFVSSYEKKYLALSVVEGIVASAAVGDTYEVMGKIFVRIRGITGPCTDRVFEYTGFPISALVIFLDKGLLF